MCRHFLKLSMVVDFFVVLLIKIVLQHTHRMSLHLKRLNSFYRTIRLSHKLCLAVLSELRV